MDCNTDLGELIEMERRRGEQFNREREAEREKWRQIGHNYTMWEWELDGREGDLRVMERDLWERGNFW